MEYFLDIADYFKLVKFNNIIIGFLIALYQNKDYKSINYKLFKRKYSSFIYIDRVVIALEYQNRGLGKTLFNDLVFLKNKQIELNAK